MKSEPWYSRYAWIVFAVLCGSVIPLVLMSLIDPSAAAGTWARFGYPVPEAVAASPAAIEYVEFIGHWSATTTLGFDIFGLAIAVTAFRRGERWAWLTMWYLPVMFFLHFVAYQNAFRYTQLVWLALSVAALAGTYRMAWSPPSANEASAKIQETARVG